MAGQTNRVRFATVLFADVALRWRRCLLSTRLRAPCADKVDDTVSLSSCYTLVPDIAQKRADWAGRTSCARHPRSSFSPNPSAMGMA